MAKGYIGEFGEKYTPAECRLMLEYLDNHYKAWQFPTGSDLRLARRLLGALLECEDKDGNEAYRLTPDGRQVAKDMRKALQG